MTDFSYTVKNGDRGLTYIFLDKAKEAGYEGDASKVNWNNVLSVFDEIQSEEKAEGEQLYSGGNDKTSSGWRNSYIIKVGDVINLTKEQIDKIYTAMGFKKAGGAAPAQGTPPAAPAQGTPPAAPVQETDPTVPPKPTTPPPAVTPPSAKTPPAKLSQQELMKYSISDKKNAGKSVLQPDGTTIEYTKNGRISRILDETGNVTRDIYYNSDGSVDCFYDFEYDGAGNRTRAISYNSDGSVRYFDDYEYANGNRTREISYNSDSSVDCFYDFEYDGAGNRTRAISYNSDGSVRYFDDYEYANGNRTRDISYNSDGSVNYYTVFEYDEAVNQVSQQEYNPDGTKR